MGLTELLIEPIGGLDVVRPAIVGLHNNNINVLPERRDQELAEHFGHNLVAEDQVMLVVPPGKINKSISPSFAKSGETANVGPRDFPMDAN